VLSDVKPDLKDQHGKYTSLEFDRCTYLQNPKGDSTVNCIDYLSDTGWTVPQPAKGAAAHELVLRFAKPVSMGTDQRLTLTVDSGGSNELAVLNRIRFAFHHAASAAPVDNEANLGQTPAAVQTLQVRANDGGTGKPIETFRVIVGIPVSDSCCRQKRIRRLSWLRSITSVPVRFQLPTS